ncbi:uncharacterized protein DUF4037 [Stackebrandtia endophytica]|uniref:Uncharacterized protein DUF4037 n=1 Tax=Stackebrandtia endophytica TaxID=1496996 RepID=A0A543APV0_9ACTN|nr:DUF4037 domain-containing protein [Stackebrandtia endophytica]TQL74604.1 uncharacterized protein DUF4037 [Stackebrandtia endophytica]
MSGMELSRRLFEEAVRPILADEFPDVVYSAARLGPGSEVLGFDSVRSTDHDWGPQLLLLLDPGDVTEYGADIASVLSHRLPKRIAGWSTHFGEAGADGTAALADTDGPVRHGIEVTDVSGWLVDRLGDDRVVAGELSTVDWLGLSQQRLGEVTAGAVFHDGSGVLERVRRRLAWYPDPVWRYLLACQWMKLSQEEAFVGRASEAGDELGSMVVAARQVREVMRLALLQSRRYAPYSKWLGTAFTRFVPGSDRLGEVLRAVVGERDPGGRQSLLCEAYEEMAGRHNTLGLTEPLDPGRRRFHGRPFEVLMADRFAVALRDSIEDPVLRGLPLIGGVDQWIDNTDALTVTRVAAAAVYSAG